MKPAASGSHLTPIASGLDPSAGQNYVDYQFKLQSGDYLETFAFEGRKFENSTASSSYYERTFTSQLLSEVLRITAPGASGVDILERRKTRFRFIVNSAWNCDQFTEETREAFIGAFVANKNGPVRSIRSHLGFGSGAIEQVHLFYEQREDITVHWRAHELLTNLTHILVDHDPAAIGMTYFNNNNIPGVVIDGVPDSIVPGVLQWELVTGAPGSLVTIQDIVTSFENLTATSYYLDDDGPAQQQCAGDAFAIGTSGQVIRGIPDTDPTTSSETLAWLSSRYYGPPGWTVANAQQLRAFSENPLVTTVPEPSSALVSFVAVAALGMLARNKHRNCRL